MFALKQSLISLKQLGRPELEKPDLLQIIKQQQNQNIGQKTNTFGELSFGSALFACQTFADLILAVSTRTELRSRQTPLADLASDWPRCCFDGVLLVPCHIATEPFLARRRAALLAHDPVRLRAVPPILRPEKS